MYFNLDIHIYSIYFNLDINTGLIFFQYNSISIATFWIKKKIKFIFWFCNAIQKICMYSFGKKGFSTTYGNVSFRNIWINVALNIKSFDCSKLVQRGRKKLGVYSISYLTNHKMPQICKTFRVCKSLEFTFISANNRNVCTQSLHVGTPLLLEDGFKR